MSLTAVDLGRIQVSGQLVCKISQSITVLTVGLSKCAIWQRLYEDKIFANYIRFLCILPISLLLSHSHGFFYFYSSFSLFPFIHNLSFDNSFLLFSIFLSLPFTLFPILFQPLLPYSLYPHVSLSHSLSVCIVSLTSLLSFPFSFNFT